MSLNGEPNYDLYETNVGRGYRLSRGLGSLAVGVGLLGFSLAYYLVRKAGSGAKRGSEMAINTLAAVVEYDSEDSANPVTVERLGKKH